MSIEKLVKDLDENLIVIETKKVDKIICIICKNGKNESNCFLCNHSCNSIHSKCYVYYKKFGNAK